MSDGWRANIAGALLVLALTACAEPPGYSYYGPGPAGAWSLEEQAAFVATTSAIHAGAQATYQARVDVATRVAAEATGQAQALASATAARLAAEERATAGAATATAGSLLIQQTAAAMQAQATATSVAISGTATAVAALGQFDRERLAAEAGRLQLENRRTAAEVQRAVYYAEFTRYLPWLVVGALVVAAAAAYGFLQRQARPLVVVANGHEEVLVPPRYYARLPLALPPPAALPATAPVSSRPVELPALAEGHVLIAGETGSGKTTALQAVLRHRPGVVVLDPHAAPGAWGGAQVIGGGRDFEAIGVFMRRMQALLSARYAERAAGAQDFSPLTVATDEMPAIVAALGQQIGATWRQWAREGRKVGLFLAISTQSTRVRTLGIEGEADLLENFDVLLLGRLAAAQFPDAVAGMERPAVLRSLHRVLPVIIPRSATQAARPVINLPAANAEDQDAARIRALAAQGLSRRRIEEAVFGYAGGEAWERVKGVLETPAGGRYPAAT